MYEVNYNGRTSYVSSYSYCRIRPEWLVKLQQSLLAETLAKICNTSFREDLFPANPKEAVVRRQLKKKPTLDPDDANSFRPLSNLSCLSKVVERIAAAGLTCSVHIESQQLLPSRQSACRAHHSTETAVISVHNETFRTIDAGDVCAVVLLDLSAAFDTVDAPTHTGQLTLQRTLMSI